jgi:hypothetical protein
MAPLVSTLLILVLKFNEHTIEMIKSCRQSNNPNEKYDFQTLSWLYSVKSLFMLFSMKFKTVGLIGKQAQI